jgi:ribosomal protein S18 acetylase RimI-like enzyme
MVKLVPMDPSDFNAYLERSTAGYAEEHVKSGNWQPADALEKARAEFNHLLPDGLKTTNNFIYSIVDDASGKKMGILWVEVGMDKTPRGAFGYDFEIYEEYRGKGFGKQALVALDEILRSMDVESMGLHVFAHNSNALELYKKMGFEMTNVHMRKYYKKK